jgi:hypothetical protein
MGRQDVCTVKWEGKVRSWSISKYYGNYHETSKTSEQLLLWLEIEQGTSRIQVGSFITTRSGVLVTKSSVNSYEIH